MMGTAEAGEPALPSAQAALASQAYSDNGDPSGVSDADVNAVRPPISTSSGVHGTAMFPSAAATMCATLWSKLPYVKLMRLPKLSAFMVSCGLQ